MTQIQLAMEMECDNSQISNYERGGQALTRDVAEKLGTVFKLTRDERGLLLLSSGHQPKEREIRVMRRVARYALLSWQFPAYLADFSGRLLAWNIRAESVFPFLNRFGDEILKIHPHTLTLIFDHRYGLRTGTTQEEWERLARAYTGYFKWTHEFHTHHPWYRELIDRDLGRNRDFRAIWSSTPPIEPTMIDALEFVLRSGGPTHRWIPVTGQIDPRFELFRYLPDKREMEAYEAVVKLRAR